MSRCQRRTSPRITAHELLTFDNTTPNTQVFTRAPFELFSMHSTSRLCIENKGES